MHLSTKRNAFAKGTYFSYDYTFEVETFLKSKISQLYYVAPGNGSYYQTN